MDSKELRKHKRMYIKQGKIEEYKECEKLIKVHEKDIKLYERILRERN